MLNIILKEKKAQRKAKEFKDILIFREGMRTLSKDILAKYYWTSSHK